MSVNVLRELDELRSLLDTPKKVFTVGSQFESPRPGNYSVAAASPSSQAAETYSYALNSAEKSVDRLGRAIEHAEDEMDAAIRRTTEVHKSTLRQKETELHEMQRLSLAKERAVESLRDTLVTTKRAYESRLSQTEEALALRDAEATAAQDGLRAAHAELQSSKLHLQQVLAAHADEMEEFRRQERDLQVNARARGDESSRLGAQLRTEREDRQVTRRECEELRRRAELLAEELRVARGDARIAQERAEAEVHDLSQKLRAEKSLRKGCEKWLRAELRSREEYDMLLTAIRETATIKPARPADDFGPSRNSFLTGGSGGEMRLPSPLARIPGATGEVQDVELLLRDLKASRAAAAGRQQQAPTSAAVEAAYARHRDMVGGGGISPRYRDMGGGGDDGGGGTPPGTLRGESEAARRKLERDNKELRAEVLAARRLLQERAAGGR